MTKQAFSTILIYVAFLALILGFAFMTRENARLTMVNHHLEEELQDTQTELVDSQNKAYGYKWQLEQIGRDEGWSEDE